MEEARTESEQIYVNDGGIMKIICPFCGALQTPRRRSYEDAQDAAEDAAAQCDCDEAREWRMRTVAKCTVKPFRADAKPENVEVAACKFCGQTQPVPVGNLLDSGLSAREYVSRMCKCGAARTYQAELEAERRRAQTMHEAWETIESMFALEDATDEKAVRSRGIVTGELLNLAALVYDKRIKKTTVNISSQITAVISLNKNDGLKIEKKKKTSEAAEI